MRRALPALLAALALLLPACSGSGQAETTTTAATTTTATTTTTTSTTTTTAPPTTTTTSTTTTTTTTLPPGSPAPLNGLPVADDALLSRRVVAVKVDNHPLARPQSGLQEADAVIEIIVEGGITRFIALFHQSDSGYVGPVRSVRPTDSAMLAPLDPVFLISGGQTWIQALANSRGIPLIGEGSAGLFRMSHRSAPHNLYADTWDARATADARGYDDDINGPLYAIGEWVEPSERATTITLDWAAGHVVTWEYSQGRYRRAENGVNHSWIDGAGDRAQLAFEVLVVIEGRYYMAQPPPTGRSAVPAIETVGSGTLLVFSGGRVLEGTWERDALDEPFRLFDADGNPAVVPPGVPWISVFPEQRALTWS